MTLERLEFNKDSVDLDAYFGKDTAETEARAKKSFLELVATLAERGLTVATAESFTGGYIGKLITDVAGSSAVFRGAIVAYVNEIKESLLGVSPDTIEKHTEVSFEAALEMAEGVRRLFGSDIAISTTGYAGPMGGNERDPVGTVYICISVKGNVRIFRVLYSGDRLERETVRLCSAYLAARELACMIE